MSSVRYLFLVLVFIIVLMGVEFFWLFLKKENNFIAVNTDTSISNEAHFIRHRSQTDLFEVFGLGPGLLPYFPSDFIYSAPSYLNAKEEIR